MDTSFESMLQAFPDLFKRIERIEDLLLERSMPQKIQSDLLNIQQASEMLNLSIPTIYSKVSKRELPYSKRGKKLYFSRTELLDFVKSGRRLTNEEVGNLAVASAAQKMKGGVR